MTRIIQEKSVLVLLFITLSLIGTSAISIAALPLDEYVESAKAVGSMNAQTLLAMVCLALCALSFYLVRTLITMAKKPCVYNAKTK